MIWAIFATLAAAIVAILPALAIGWLCARGIKGWGPGAFNSSVTVFALVFAAIYVASLYALIVWWV